MKKIILAALAAIATFGLVWLLSWFINEHTEEAAIIFLIIGLVGVFVGLFMMFYSVLEKDEE